MVFYYVNGVPSIYSQDYWMEDYSTSVTNDIPISSAPDFSKRMFSSLEGKHVLQYPLI